MSKLKNNIAIAVPSYNEKRNIEELTDKIFENFPKSFLFIVDDNSPDGTQDVVKKLTKKYQRLTLVTRSSKSGRGGAILEGFRLALTNSNTSYFIEMDADLSHSPKEIGRLLGKVGENTVVIGSRYVDGSKIISWPIQRRVLSRLANWYIRSILKVPINDFTNGFRCYPRHAVEYIAGAKINHKGFITLSETAYKLYKKGFRFVEVPIVFRDREKGHSSATIFEVLGSLLSVLQIRFK